MLARSYAPGKWSGARILAHVADTELVFFYRFLKAAAEEGSPVVPFDQDHWMAELHAVAPPPSQTIGLVRSLRQGFVHHLRTLPARTLERVAVHPERGPLTPLSIARIVAGHGRHHLTQIAAIRQGRAWQAGESVPYWT